MRWKGYGILIRRRWGWSGWGEKRIAFFLYFFFPFCFVFIRDVERCDMRSSRTSISSSFFLPLWYPIDVISHWHISRKDKFFSPSYIYFLVVVCVCPDVPPLHSLHPVISTSSNILNRFILVNHNPPSHALFSFLLLISYTGTTVFHDHIQ